MEGPGLDDARHGHDGDGNSCEGGLLHGWGDETRMMPDSDFSPLFIHRLVRRFGLGLSARSRVTSTAVSPSALVCLHGKQATATALGGLLKKVNTGKCHEIRLDCLFQLLLIGYIY